MRLDFECETGVALPLPSRKSYNRLAERHGVYLVDTKGKRRTAEDSE
jgi:hypothetical protein